MHIRGYLVRKKLDLLYGRLAVKLALDRTEHLDCDTPLTGPVACVRLRRGSIGLDEEGCLHEVDAASLSSLSVLRGPAASYQSPVASKRRTNVAGVLGLFCGVLLAFFWHWLREPPAEQAAPQGD